MRELHYRWEWGLRSSPQALWPLVADTNRFNRDAGIAAVEEHGPLHRPSRLDAFYREVGDAPAFGSVMDHLDVLREAVEAEQGAVVKAMGDAIMAAFVRPVGAVRAVLRVQRALAAPSEDRRPLLLKAGVHTGPCIAITQNDRLDYFGSTVNIAARLVGLSSGNDLVVSAAVLDDPEVAMELSGGAVTAEPFEASLKGLEEERFELFRLVAPAEVRVGA